MARNFADLWSEMLHSRAPWRLETWRLGHLASGRLLINSPQPADGFRPQEDAQGEGLEVVQLGEVVGGRLPAQRGCVGADLLGLVAPEITDETAGCAARPAIATSRRDRSRASAYG